MQTYKDESTGATITCESELSGSWKLVSKKRTKKEDTE